MFYIKSNVSNSLNQKKFELEKEVNHKLESLTSAVQDAEAKVMEARDEIDGKVKQLSSSFNSTSIQLQKL